MFKRFALIGLLFVSQALAANELIYQDDGTAIDGYDAVAYHTDNKAVEGNRQYSHDWNGATWHFASAANRDRFGADPAKYAPEYNGYCAYAASQGYIASTDAEAWTIKNGKLYLNYSKSVRSRWLKKVDQYIADGDNNWPGLVKQLDAG